MARTTQVIGTIAVALAALLIGLAVSFFTAGAGLFSDGPGPLSRFYVVAMGAGAFFVLGLLGAIAIPSRWRTWGIWLGIGVVPVTLVFGEFSGRPDWLGWAILGASFVVSFLAASLFGSWLGARIRGQ